MLSTREAYGQALAEMGEKYDFYVLDADLSKATQTVLFAKKFPERFMNMGIAESNMMDFAAGISYADYKAMTDKQHLSKAKSMPVKFLKASGKGFFIEKENYTLAIRDDLAEVIEKEAFQKHMKDILEYRTMEYYRRRYTGES